MSRYWNIEFPLLIKINRGKKNCRVRDLNRRSTAFAIVESICRFIRCELIATESILIEEEKEVPRTGFEPRKHCFRNR